MWPQTMGWFPFYNLMEKEHSNNGELSQIGKINLNCCSFIYRYILELHRIPPQSSTGPKSVVLLMHGVLESSGTWLVNPSSRSLGIKKQIKL